jgi:hypothetical protein
MRRKEPEAKHAAMERRVAALEDRAVDSRGYEMDRELFHDRLEVVEARVEALLELLNNPPKPVAKRTPRKATK